MVNTANLINRTPKKNQHLIERVVFSQGLVECRCGAVVRAEGHDNLRDAFTMHRNGHTPLTDQARAQIARGGQCKRGHELTTDNVRIRRQHKGNGYRRECRECYNARQREYMARMKGVAA